MGYGTNVLEQPVYDLTDTAVMVGQNTLTALRAATVAIPKNIRYLEKRRSDLKSFEGTLLQRLWRYKNSIEIEGESADSYMKTDFVQEYDTLRQTSPDPAEVITYLKNKLLRVTPGMEELLKELERVQHLIKETNQRIHVANTQLKEANKRIENLSQAGSTAESKLLKDRLATRQLAELYMLWQIHNRYRDVSRNSEGKTKHTEDNKIVSTLNILRGKFLAFAERNPWVLSGELQLDFQDPGSDENGENLSARVENIKLTSGNFDIPDKVKYYSDKMFSTINDRVKSKNLKRNTSEQLRPPQDQSLKEALSNCSKVLDYVSTVQWHTRFTIDRFAEAVERKFLKDVLNLHNKTAFCAPVPKSEEEEVEEAQAAQFQADEKKAQEELAKAQSRADPPLVVSTAMLEALKSKAESDGNAPLFTFMEQNPFRLYGTLEMFLSSKGHLFSRGAVEAQELRGIKTKYTTVKFGIGISFKLNRSPAFETADAKAVNSTPQEKSKPEPKVVERSLVENLKDAANRNVYGAGSVATSDL